MGTRHLVAVIYKGKRRIAQYGQFDGYFTGVGSDVFNFIMNVWKPDEFEKHVAELSFYKRGELNTLYKECNKSQDAATAVLRENPAVSNHFSTGVLYAVQNGTVKKVVDSWSFGADSLFCEYAYVINLDTEVVECYVGFNKGKAKGRFARLKPVRSYGNEYNQCTLFKKVPFSKITATLAEELEKEYNDYREKTAVDDK